MFAVLSCQPSYPLVAAKRDTEEKNFQQKKKERRKEKE